MSSFPDDLWEICEQHYFRLNLRIRSAKTRKQYRHAIDNLAAFLGRSPTRADLCDDAVVGMMGMLLDKKLDPRTVNDRKDRIHALWSWLARRGHVTVWPTTRGLPNPERCQESWTIESLNALIVACRNARGMIGNVPASDWWIGWHALQWNTGERFGALIETTAEMLNGSTLIIPHSVRKGRRKDARYVLWEPTLNALARIQARSQVKLLLPWPYCHGTFWNRYEKLLKSAKLPGGRYCKTQKIRRSVATYIALNGGDATAALLHSSDAVTRKSYLDYSICRPQQQDVLPRLEGLE